MSKLKKELDVVQQNCRVLSEMLTEMTPGQESPSDLELLTVSNTKPLLDAWFALEFSFLIL